MKKKNIAIAGGSCTGKSTLAAALFAKLKELGFDYDVIPEQSRIMQAEFGLYRSPFERFFMWRLQEHAEKNSTAVHGFITDAPLFHFYVQARIYAQEDRDQLAVHELMRMSLEAQTRYDLIVIAKDPEEIPFKRDTTRKSTKYIARQKHDVSRTFIEHFLRTKTVVVKGTVAQRVSQVLKKMKELGWNSRQH